MHRPFLLFVLLNAGILQAQLPHWQNPEVVNVNKLPARATSVSYPSRELAIKTDRDASPRKMTLNGDWKFSWYEAPSHVPPDFFQPAVSDKDWKTLPVPSNWELHGYGKPWHRLTHQIWQDKGIRQPRVPEDYNPTGCYRKTIDLPKNWKNLQVTLHVGAASSTLVVWVNGNYVGYSEDNRLPAEFDITPWLKEKNNVIALQVMQWSDGSYLEDQDHWRMSGITREVYLEAAPKVQLYDFAVRTELDENYEHAKLQIRPEIKLYELTDVEGWTLEAELLDNMGAGVLDMPLKVGLPGILNEYHPEIGNRPFENLMEATVRSPEKWSAEHPNLYTLVLSLKNEGGQLIEARSTRIGFREVDISDGQFRVNGVPVLLYGVNRHDWDANTGKAVTKEAMRRDAELMKRLNVNASRSSHYPNPPYWYELCDEYGIYVMDEANIESHGHGSLFSNIPAWHTTFLERGIRMVERDKNYPSIVSWSLGNEAGFGPNHAALSAWIREFDPTRPIHAEGAQNIYGYNWPKPEPKDRIYTDIISRMYRLTDDMIDLATKTDDNRPVIWCEYAHSQGNSTGDMEGYWKAIRKYPRFVGGFVWDWRDQLIAKESNDGRTLWAYGADFKQEQADLNPVQKGLISADGEIKSGGWQARKVWQRVVFTINDPATGELTLFNRHFRTNLNTYDLVWEILKDGKPLDSGKIRPPDVLPGKSGSVKLELPDVEGEPGIRYHLNVALALKQDRPWAGKGFKVASEQFLWKYTPGTKVSPQGTLRIEETDDRLEIMAGESKVVFDKGKGRLIEYSEKGFNVVQRAPQPNFWRAPTDNDLASKMPERQGMWKEASENHELMSISTRQSDDVIIVETLHRVHASGVMVRQRYAIPGEGSIEVNYRFTPPAGVPALPRLGWQMQVPASLDRFTWFGRGPLESYADKKTGMFYGRYEQSVRKDYTWYVRPQESSNKADVFWLELRDEEGSGLRIEAVDSPLSVSAWPFTQEEIAQANRIEDLVFGEFITLNIDARQMGVGGDNTWNIDAAPHASFRIPAEPYEYSFRMRLLKKK